MQLRGLLGEQQGNTHQEVAQSTARISPGNALHGREVYTNGAKGSRWRPERRNYLLAVQLLLQLAARLRLDGQRRGGTREQPGNADRVAGLLAVAVAAVVDASQRLVDLLQQLALAVAGAQFQRVLLLDRRLVGRDRARGRARAGARR